MTRFFKGLALFALITCGVWVAVLWHWQSTSRDIGTRDIVTYLGALPLTLFGLALLTRWAWLGIAEKQAQRSAAEAAGATGAEPAAPTTDDAARHVTVKLLAAHLVCAGGSSASDLQSAARDGAPRPALDAELRDEDGLPIVSARIAGLDVPAMTTLLEPLLAAMRARRPDWSALAPDDHVVRALAALEGPLAAAVDALLPWSARFVAEPVAGSVGSAAERQIESESRVRVLLGWPGDWSAFEQELGRTYAADCLASNGGSMIPARCFVITAHAGMGDDLLLHADRLLQTLAREGRDEPVIVAACQSAISEAAVEAMERAGTLYGPKRPKGQMPGEAAAALVLAGVAWPAAPDTTADAAAPLPHLHRPTLLRRDKSVDAAGRISSEVIGQAVVQALATGRITADALAGLVCDADLHTPRAAEFYGASVDLLPALDSTEDMRLLGTIVGAVGVVGPLLVVACAAERAVAAEKPQLALTLGDAFARLALVVLPAAPPPEAVDEKVRRAAAKNATKPSAA